MTKKIGSERPDDISEPEKTGQANTFQELVLYGNGRRFRRCGFSSRLGPEKPTPAFGEVLMVALGGGSAHLDAKPVAEEAHIVHDRPVFRDGQGFRTRLLCQVCPQVASCVPKPRPHRPYPASDAEASSALRP